MASVPNSINTVSAQAANIQPTGGADPGVGFHSQQPINIARHDPTEQTHFKNRLEGQDQDIRPEPVSVYPKYPESPFVRYVSRPLSDGELSASVQNYKLEDRSQMGTPLNPFWIRNDLWSMNHEADIFADSGPNWVAPRIRVGGAQSLPGYDRSTYLDNQEQPQHSTQAAPLTDTTSALPAEPAAGTVTASASVAAKQTDMDIPDSNPAVTNKDEKESEDKEKKAGGSGEAKVGDTIHLDDGPPSPKKRKKAPAKKKVSS